MNPGTESKITLLILTHNRPKFLLRTLEYYLSQKVGAKIIVVDNGRYPTDVSPYSSHINYFHIPGYSYAEQIYFGSRQINTPYSVICPDDDFISPRAISHCIEFLENNEAYSCVLGHYVNFFTIHKKLMLSPSLIHAIGLDINENSPKERITSFFKNPTVLLYSVQRTCNLIRAYENAVSLIFTPFLTEFLSNYAAVIYGKVKVLPIFYCARQILKNSAGTVSTPLSEITSSDHFQNEFNAFISIITEQLIRMQPMGKQEAIDVVKSSLNDYLSEQKRREERDRMIYDGDFAPWKQKIKNNIIFKNIILPPYYRFWAIHKIQRSFSSLVKNIPGFPFKDKQAIEEWKPMKALIIKYKQLLEENG